MQICVTVKLLCKSKLVLSTEHITWQGWGWIAWVYMCWSSIKIENWLDIDNVPFFFPKIWVGIQAWVYFAPLGFSAEVYTTYIWNSSLHSNMGQEHCGRQGVGYFFLFVSWKVHIVNTLGFVAIWSLSKLLNSITVQNFSNFANVQNSHRQYINEGAWPYSNKPLSTKPGRSLDLVCRP